MQLFYVWKQVLWANRKHAKGVLFSPAVAHLVLEELLYSKNYLRICNMWLTSSLLYPVDQIDDVGNINKLTNIIYIGHINSITLNMTNYIKHYNKLHKNYIYYIWTISSNFFNIRYILLVNVSKKKFYLECIINITELRNWYLIIWWQFISIMYHLIYRKPHLIKLWHYSHFQLLFNTTPTITYACSLVYTENNT